VLVQAFPQMAPRLPTHLDFRLVVLAEGVGADSHPDP